MHKHHKQDVYHISLLLFLKNESPLHDPFVLNISVCSAGGTSEEGAESEAGDGQVLAGHD